MLTMWQWSKGGMGGRGYLPDAGGSLDQLARNMDVLAVCNGAEAWVDEFLPPPRPSSDRPRRARRGR